MYVSYQDRLDPRMLCLFEDRHWKTHSEIYATLSPPYRHSRVEHWTQTLVTIDRTLGYRNVIMWFLFYETEYGQYERDKYTQEKKNMKNTRRSKI